MSSVLEHKQPMSKEELQRLDYLKNGAYHWKIDPTKRGGSLVLERYQKVSRIVEELNPKIVLDVGGGDGRLTNILESICPKAINVDFDTFALSLARSKSRNQIVIPADAVNLPFQPDSIDVICCVETLEHNSYETAIRIVEEFYRVLKKGGMLVLTMPSTNIPVTPKHYLHYNPEILSKLLVNYSNFSIDGLEKANVGHMGYLLKLTSNRYWTIPILGRIIGLELYKRLYGTCQPDQARTLLATAVK